MISRITGLAGLPNRPVAAPPSAPFVLTEHERRGVTAGLPSPGGAAGHRAVGRGPAWTRGGGRAGGGRGSPVTVLCVGRLGEHKGQVWLLDLYLRARPAFQRPARLVFVGKDEGDSGGRCRPGPPHRRARAWRARLCWPVRWTTTTLARLYALGGSVCPVLALRGLWAGLLRGDGPRRARADPPRGRQRRGARPGGRAHRRLYAATRPPPRWLAWSTIPPEARAWAPRRGLLWRTRYSWGAVATRYRRAYQEPLTCDEGERGIR